MKKQESYFIEKVARFLTILENNYPDIISISRLKKEFGKDYERIIKYLHGERELKKQLITGNKDGWRINNWNLEEVQKLISRSINENILKEQNKFNRAIALTGLIIALIQIFGFVAVDYQKIAEQTHYLYQLIFLITVGVFITISAGLLTKELFDLYLKKYN